MDTKDKLAAMVGRKLADTIWAERERLLKEIARLKYQLERSRKLHDPTQLAEREFRRDFRCPQCGAQPWKERE